MTPPGDPSEKPHPVDPGAPTQWGGYEPPPIERSPGQPGYQPPSGYPPPGYTPPSGSPPPSYPPPGYTPPPQYGSAPGSGYPPPPQYGSPPGGYAPGYPGAGYPGGYGPQQPATNPLAISSLVASGLGIPLSFCYIGWLGSIAGIVLGFVALSQIKQSNERGRGLAIAGIAVGAGWLLLSVILVVVLIIIGASMPTVT